MLIRYLLFSLTFFYGNFLFAQCSSCDITVAVPDAGSYSANAGETICLTGTGNFTGTISLNTDGTTPVLCIGSDVVFTSGNLNTNTNDATVNNYGTIENMNINSQGTINNFGTMSLTGLAVNNGTFNNSGDITVTGTFNLNNSSTFNNSGSISVTDLNLNQGTFNNTNTTFGAVDITNNLTVNSNTSLNLDGGITVGGDLTGNGGTIGLNGAGIAISGTFLVNGSGANIIASGSSSGCEGISYGSITLNNTAAFSGGVDICNTTDPSATPAASGTSQCNCSTLLPVEFIYYGTEADYQHNRVTVTWATAMEQNSASFSIERSTNGFDFTSLGNVVAVGNSQSINSYAFYDDTPILGKAYYRIKQIDVDGSYTYTSVMVQYYENQQSAGSMIVSISQTAIQLTFSEYVEEGQLEIIDSSGKLITKQHIDVNAYKTIFEQRILRSGMYILRFSSKEKLWMQKVLMR